MPDLFDTTTEAVDRILRDAERNGPDPIDVICGLAAAVVAEVDDRDAYLAGTDLSAEASQFFLPVRRALALLGSRA